MTRTVIVGAGQAGFQAAVSLREAGFDGDVLLIGDEPGLPYQRPPLSKAYLAGKVGEETLPFRPEAFFGKQRIEMMMGERAVAIEPGARRIELSGGKTLGYDHLILATGARNRIIDLPGADLYGVVSLRDRDEALAIRERLKTARDMVVIGGGFIGLEIAAAARAAGVKVHILEAAPRLMGRAASPEISAFFADAHRRRGAIVDIGVRPTRIVGTGTVTGVATDDGRTLPADLVVVAIGIVPNVELAASAGLPVDDGILVDDHLASGDPAISAIGDCARFPSPFFGGARVRLESVQNAIDQARCVVARLMGRPASYAAAPWFWTDQYEYKLQMAGLTMGCDRRVVRGAPQSGQFSVFCFRGDDLAGVESVNRPGDYMAGRKLLGSRAPLTPAQAANADFDLKAHLAAHAANV